jgi:hypothetical protein
VLDSDKYISMHVTPSNLLYDVKVRVTHLRHYAQAVACGVIKHGRHDVAGLIDEAMAPPDACACSQVQKQHHRKKCH